MKIPFANMDSALVTDRVDSVLVLTLNRPEARNALSPALINGLSDALKAAKDDDGVRAVIITGAGEKAFCAGMDLRAFAEAREGGNADMGSFDALTWFHKGGFPKPVIAAVNGPAWRHSEIPLLCDIVLAADTAQFQDSAHFPSDVVPGDGMHIVYPLLLGMNRGRYFLLTGQTLNAQKALELGLVAEVLPPDKLLGRAWELAEDLARRPTLLLRYTRLLLTEALRRQMHDLLGYGLGMELLALGEKPDG